MTSKAAALRGSTQGPGLRGSDITLDKITSGLFVETKLRRQTKIICTMGPACWEVPQLEELIDAGMSVARFNFSHGDHEGHFACLERLREASKNKNKHVGE
jgi:pyruvate kinase